MIYLDAFDSSTQDHYPNITKQIEHIQHPIDYLSSTKVDFDTKYEHGEAWIRLCCAWRFHTHRTGEFFVFIVYMLYISDHLCNIFYDNAHIYTNATSHRLTSHSYVFHNTIYS